MSNEEKKEMWLEYLIDGVWIVRKSGYILLGYKIKNDPCYEAQDWEYGVGLAPDFYERAEQLGLEPIKVDCIKTIFENKVGKNE